MKRAIALSGLAVAALAFLLSGPLVLLALLLPIARIAAPGGPMNTRPATAHAAAKSAFSARKP